MEKRSLKIAVMLLAFSVGIAAASIFYFGPIPDVPAIPEILTENPPVQPTVGDKTLEMVFVLDTTGSMGGLIEWNDGISIHHSLYISNNDRNPKTKGILGDRLMAAFQRDTWHTGPSRTPGGRICPHQDGDGSLGHKPRPRMLPDLAAVHGIDLFASTHVGNSDKDRGAALAAGIGTFIAARDFFGW